MSSCIFCKIVSGEIPAEIVYRDEFIVAFNDISPQAPTHLLVVPVEHFDTLSEFAERDSGYIGEVVQRVVRLTKQLGHSEYRMVTNCGEGAGQSVFHLHFHILAGRRFGWPPG